MGRSRAFSRPWSASIGLFAYCSTVCSAEGINSSSNPWIGRSTIGRDLGRGCAGVQWPGEEMSGSGQVTLGRQQDVDDLAVLVDGPVEISPCASDLHIGLVDERPVTGAWRHGRAASMNSRGESLNPPVDGDVIHGDATLSQQLFDVAVRQS